MFFSRILAFFRRKTRIASNCACEHCINSDFWRVGKDFTVEQKILGATLGWDGTVTPTFQWTKTCLTCGHSWHSTGILPYSIFSKEDIARFWPTGYGKCWPVNPDTDLPLEVCHG